MSEYTAPDKPYAQWTDEEKAAYREHKAQRQSRLMAGLEEFKARLEELDEDDALWLRVMKFAQYYSLNNAMLIVMQDPEAVHVAAKGGWAKHGRRLAKGSAAGTVYILAPAGSGRKNKKADEAEDEQPTDDAKRAKPRFYTMTAVWDVRWTTPIKAVEAA